MMSSGRDDLCGGAGGSGGGAPHRTPPSAAVEAEMRLYLDKLREIVPHIPRNRKVTRLELIQHVIDYICDLQHALEDHPGLKDEHAGPGLLTPPHLRPHQLSPMAPHLMPPAPPLHAHLAASPHHMLPSPPTSRPAEHSAHLPLQLCRLTRPSGSLPGSVDLNPRQHPCSHATVDSPTAR
ncbi:hypothetical protein C7M84_013286 [Penaeus vannamei]|uniref:BHLH domain-containing protein n=1 Tax=Penaeus vannamei TaxID=6689 RepID=A0A423SWE7_PENVA|nr:hypothetical protein C7M84_013286 [Penaeus vannamei]